MKRLLPFVLSFFVTILLIQFNGCYTQLGTSRYESAQEEESYAQDQENEVDAENVGQESKYEESCCGDDYRPHVGFMFYYPVNYWPSTAFGFAYNNIWTYDYYWGWYDPWYSWAYYTPYYYPYYYPFYYPYRYYPWGYYYRYDGGYINVGKRDFGSDRADQIKRRDNESQWDGSSGLRDNIPTSRVVRAPDGGTAKPRGTTESAREKTNIRDNNTRWDTEKSERNTNNNESGTRLESNRSAQTRGKSSQVRPKESGNGEPQKKNDNSIRSKRESVRNNTSRGESLRYVAPRNSDSHSSSGVRSGSSTNSRSPSPSYTPPSSSSSRGGSAPSSSGSSRGSGSGGRRP